MDSNLANDIAKARKQLNGFEYSENSPLSALSSLAETCATVWRAEAELEKSDTEFFLLHEETAALVEGMSILIISLL